MSRPDPQGFWRANLILLGVLLSVWALVSLVFSILLADVLDHVRVGGFKLGFWFAQQGSILVFLALILIYIAVIGKLEKKYGVEEE